MKAIRYGCLFTLFWCAGFLNFLSAQVDTSYLINTPVIYGSLQTNANFFIRDSLIGAANIPQYDRQLFGADSWLNLNYSNWGFDFAFRFDLFNNSNLLNPTDSYTDEGIGMWSIHRDIDKLGISVGYLYDQIGSGLIFRAFEERPLLIDNALYGVRLEYRLNDSWRIKGFTGRQKQQFDTYQSVVRGLTIDGFLSGGNDETPWTMAPGIGIVARTLDDPSMNNLVATLNTYPAEEAFVPKYNAYAFSAFNTLSKGRFSWYAETAFKSRDVINDPFAVAVIAGDTLQGTRYRNRTGSILYTTLSYAAPGFGITLEAKRTANFAFRTRPQEQINRGIINFLPPLTRMNTFRLTGRYNAAPQEIGELALQADFQYAPTDRLNFNLNLANITRLNDELLYREMYLEGQYQGDNGHLILGLQRQSYNQEVYEFKPGVGTLHTWTPFGEWERQLNPRQSLRFEAQAMLMSRDPQTDQRQDYGNWLFALIEFHASPAWSFALSDMYNNDPGRSSPSDANGQKEALHYPRVDVFYNAGAHIFSLSYVKQVEGVVCTGGICRLEPAFSGIKFTLNSSF